MFLHFIIVIYLSVAVLKQTGAPRMFLFLHVVYHHLTFDAWCIVGTLNLLNPTGFKIYF